MLAEIFLNSADRWSDVRTSPSLLGEGEEIAFEDMNLAVCTGCDGGREEGGISA